MLDDAGGCALLAIRSYSQDITVPGSGKLISLPYPVGQSCQKDERGRSYRDRGRVVSTALRRVYCKK